MLLINFEIQRAIDEDIFISISNDRSLLETEIGFEIGKNRSVEKYEEKKKFISAQRLKRW